MAYKQNPGRGKCSPFKNIEKLVDPPYKTGDTIKSNGNTYEIVATEGSNVKVKSGSGRITTIPAKVAQKKWVKTKEMEGVISSRPNVRTKTSIIGEEEVKREMAKSAEITPEQKRIIEFNKFATGKK